MNRSQLARWAVAVRNRLDVQRLEMRNRRSTSPVTGDVACAVSLTTYGARTAKVHQTIESIARGTVLPREMYLWLDDDAVLADLPVELQRLRERGLTIAHCRDYRSHKKYYPYVEARTAFEYPLVTADDDVVYPRMWLAELMAAHAETPELVVAQRARIMEVDAAGALTPYHSWREAADTKASGAVFPTGVSGVLYPPRVLSELRDAGDAFVDVVPHSDDAWLHFHTQRAGTCARQASDVAQDYFGIVGSQSSALWRTNVDEGGNDTQLARLYSPEFLRELGLRPLTRPTAPGAA